MELEIEAERIESVTQPACEPSRGIALPSASFNLHGPEGDD